MICECYLINSIEIVISLYIFNSLWFIIILKFAFFRSGCVVYVDPLSLKTSTAASYSRFYIVVVIVNNVVE